jgi:diaminopimelate decarboxylase
MEPDGLAVHIGSQLTSLEPFRAAFTVLARTVEELRSEGHTVARLDLGGGLGVRYQTEDIPAPADYAAVVRETVGGLGCALAFEPGRALVANAGVLVTRIVLVKDGERRHFAVVDAAMNDLLRPTLYGAHHAIVTVAESKPDATFMPYDVVGPVCETGDTFAVARPLPPVHAGDLLAICSVGAYGAVMASSYNSRPLVPEVLVDGGRFAVIRPRQTYDSMLSLYRLPEWAPALPEDRPHSPGAVRRAKQGAG